MFSFSAPEFFQERFQICFADEILVDQSQSFNVFVAIFVKVKLLCHDGVGEEKAPCQAQRFSWGRETQFTSNNKHQKYLWSKTSPTGFSPCSRWRRSEPESCFSQNLLFLPFEPRRGAACKRNLLKKHFTKILLKKHFFTKKTLCQITRWSLAWSGKCRWSPLVILSPGGCSLQNCTLGNML